MRCNCTRSPTRASLQNAIELLRSGKKLGSFPFSFVPGGGRRAVHQGSKLSLIPRTRAVNPLGPGVVTAIFMHDRRCHWSFGAKVRSGNRRAVVLVLFRCARRALSQRWRVASTYRSRGPMGSIALDFSGSVKPRKPVVVEGARPRWRVMARARVLLVRSSRKD